MAREAPVYGLSRDSKKAEEQIKDARLTLLQNDNAQNCLRANVLPYWFRAFICHRLELLF